MTGAMLDDYAEYDEAIGLDWYRLDPNLSFLLDHYLPDPADRAFAEEHVAPYGSLVGCTLARRAEETDAHGPVLRQYDRWGFETDEVVHTRPGSRTRPISCGPVSSASPITPAARFPGW